MILSTAVVFASILVLGVQSTCYLPRKFSYGGWKFSGGNKYYFGRIPVNTKIEFHCDDGYKLYGSSYAVCNPYGWGHFPTCKPYKRTCIAPPQSGNAYYKSNQKVYYVGDYVTYYCSKGYELVGSGKRECMKDGKFGPLPLPPICKRICLSPPQTAISRHNGKQKIYYVGQSVTYYCVKGYQLVGVGKRTCGKDGTFGQVPAECKRVCSPPAQSSISTHNGNQAFYYVGQKVKYSCKAGYRLVGDGIRTCTISGRFAPLPIPAQCRRICYSPPQNSISTHNGDQDFYYVGQKVTYSCKAGYMLVGNGVRTCTGSGSFAPLPLPAQCRRVCRSPPENSISTHNGDQDFYYVGQKVEYSCKAGYVLVGDGVRTCTASGNFAPLPLPAMCRRLCRSPPENSISTHDGDQDYYNVGEKVKYSCRAGYRLVGDGVRTCTASGSFAPLPLPAQCRRICRSPPENAISTHNGDQDYYYVGQKVEYSCKAGYVLVGNGVRTCSASGSFVPLPLPAECKLIKCKKPVVPNGGVFPDKEYYDVNAPVTYFCEPGYIISVGTQVGKCLATGKFSVVATCSRGPIGSCKYRCGKKPDKSYPCQCHRTCAFTGNCCKDFESECKHIKY